MNEREDVIERVKKSNLAAADKTYIVNMFDKLQEYETEEENFEKMFLDLSIKQEE